MDYCRAEPWSSFWRNARAFIFVFDKTDAQGTEINLIKNWILYVQQFCELVILVGNKIHHTDKIAISYSQGKALQKEIGASAYLECSHKTGEGIEKIVMAVARMVSSLRHEILAKIQTIPKKKTASQPVKTSYSDKTRFFHLTPPLPKGALSFLPLARIWLDNREHQKAGGGAPVIRIDETTLHITILGTDIDNVKAQLLEELAEHIEGAVGEANLIAWRIDKDSLIIELASAEITGALVELLEREGFKLTAAQGAPAIAPRPN